MSRFTKKLILEQAEVDRLRQRQLNDYSPELHTLVRLQDQIINILGREDLSAEEKLSLISSTDSRFSNLQRQLPTSAASEAVKNDTELGNQKPTDELPPDVGEMEPIPDNQIQKLENINDLLALGINKSSQRRANSLLDKIQKHPKIITKSEHGELILNTKVIPKSNFDELFKAAFIPKSEVNLVGIDEFIKGLRLLHVNSNELSSSSFKKIYIPTSPAHERIKRSAAKLEANDEQELKIFNLQYTKGKRGETNQKGKGFQKKLSPSSPPGKRARVLYVY